MLAFKRSAGLLAEDMPVTRSIKQRLEEGGQSHISEATGSIVWESAQQIEGKDTHPVNRSISFDLAAHGSLGAICEPNTSSAADQTEAALGAASAQEAAIITRSTAKHAQQGRALCEDGLEQSCTDTDEFEDQPSMSGMRCRTGPPETPQSPRRTRSQNQLDAGSSQFSTAMDEVRLCSSAPPKSSVQQTCDLASQPGCSSEQTRTVCIRQHRISVTVGATDGGSTSYSAAATVLKSCLRKAASSRADSQTTWGEDRYAPSAPASPPGSPVTRARSQQFLQALSEQERPQQAPLPREGLPTRQSSRAASQAGRRVRFADGPLQELYGTPDGHPSHEGQTARQRRSLNTSYPVDLTPHSIRMLEQELGESYRLSINRLKRRVGLLPRVSRPREYATNPRPARGVRLLPAGLPPLRVLRPRAAALEDSDDSGDELDSATSSSTVSNDMGSPMRRHLKSTASSLDSPKAPWSANSGGVRHGAARSISGSRRKSAAPARARPQSPRPAAHFPVTRSASPEPLSPPEEQIMKKPPSPRTPKHGRGPFLRPATSPKKAQQQLCLDPSQAVSQAGASSGAAESPKRSREPISHKAGRASQQAVPPIFQSPRKRPPSGGAGDGGGPELTRSPRRQRPPSSWNSNSLLGSMGSALQSSAAFALPTPLPQQQCFLLRSSSAQGSLAEAGKGQQAADKGSSCDLRAKACQHEGSSAAVEQPAASGAQAPKQAQGEAPWTGRRLRSADSMGGRRGDPAGDDNEEEGPGLRATIYDSIMAHTRLLRSSSR